MALSDGSHLHGRRSLLGCEADIAGHAAGSTRSLVIHYGHDRWRVSYKAGQYQSFPNNYLFSIAGREGRNFPKSLDERARGKS
jgi:hypothetical protein